MAFPNSIRKVRRIIWISPIHLYQLVKKVFFDKLCAVFQNLKSSGKPVIANERRPWWVSFVTIFLSDGGRFPIFLTVSCCFLICFICILAHIPPFWNTLPKKLPGWRENFCARWRKSLNLWKRGKTQFTKKRHCGNIHNVWCFVEKSAKCFYEEVHLW